MPDPTSSPPESPAPLAGGMRARVRVQITAEIVRAAREQLATRGASGLSLRAVARELGMVSSAVYRYVPSRDDLLTLLIVEAYDALGEAVEAAVARSAPADLAGRWLALCHGVRDWALAHPHEYGLIYGTPVPGYAAPQDTVEPASRVTRLLAELLVDAVAAGRGPGPGAPDLSPAVQQAIVPVRPFIPELVPDEMVITGLIAWTYLFGAVSFELFGHRHQVIEESPDLRQAFFEEEARRLGRLTGVID